MLALRKKMKIELMQKYLMQLSKEMIFIMVRRAKYLILNLLRKCLQKKRRDSIIS
jgi:hypothetical protein